MAKNSRKTIWLILAVLMLIMAQVAILGFIISRFVSGRATAQAQRRSQRDFQQFPTPVARPVQGQDSRRFTTTNPKLARKPKPTGPRAEQPTFSMAGGNFTNSISVELKAPSPKAVIRYTLDGSDPLETSPTYSAPVIMRTSTMLRAACFESGLAPSMSVTHSYSLLDDALAGFSSNLPLIVLNTSGRSINYVNYSPASVRFIDTENGRANLLSAADFDGRAEIKRRGFSSLRYPKMSLTLKTRDDDGDKVKSKIFGLPSDSDWVLYAPYVDKTMMRDVVSYELSNLMGRYAPRTKFVEAFIHNSSGPLNYSRDYAGVYVLVEKIKRGKHRVNIDKLDTNDLAEPNISGGFILKRDHGASGGGRGGSMNRPSNDGVGFITPRGLHLFYVEPDEDELAPAQKQWLSRYFSDFEKALYGSKFSDPKTGYAKYLDVDSFIDQFWLAELTKNVDAFRYSAFLHKPRGGKITMGPAWDWNLSLGNADYYDAYETGGWYYENLRDTEISWVYRLRQDPDYQQRSIDRWAELRSGPWATDKMLARIDALREQLQEAQQRNFRKWSIMGREIRPNYYVGPTFDAEVSWMKMWLKDRATWLDRQNLVAPKLSEASGAMAVGTKLKLTGSSGDIYYTLDGTDPRAPGGSISKSARRYGDAIVLESATKLTARLMRRDSWSAPTKADFTIRK